MEKLFLLINECNPGLASSVKSAIQEECFNHFLRGESINRNSVTNDILLPMVCTAIESADTRKNFPSGSILKIVEILSQLRVESIASSACSNPSSKTLSSKVTKGSRASVNSNKTVLNNKTQSGVLKVRLPTYPVLAESASQYKAIRAILRPLSEKSKQLYLSVAPPDRIYKYCNLNGCMKCLKCFNNVPLTKCSHPDDKKCNEVGLFPHLSRSTWKIMHNSANIPSLACFVKHFNNPRIDDDMEVDAFEKNLSSKKQNQAEARSMIMTRSKSARAKVQDPKVTVPKDVVVPNLLDNFGKSGGSVSVSKGNKRSAVASSDSSIPESRVSLATALTKGCDCGSPLIDTRRDGTVTLVCFKHHFNGHCDEWLKHMI